VLHIVQPPYNIHPGILGLAVNVTVLSIATALYPSATPHPTARFADKGRNTKRILFACGFGLVAIANWPVLVMVNRIYPFILGLPFFIFVMLVLNISVGLLLFVAYQVTDRYVDSARPSGAAPGLAHDAELR